MLMECIFSLPFKLYFPESLTLHYRPGVPWGPHRKRKEDGWNCPFYGDVLLLGFTLLRLEVNPSSSCHTKQSTTRLRYLHTLLYGGCKRKSYTLTSAHGKNYTLDRVPRPIRRDVMGLNPHMLRRVTGADSGRHGSGAVSAHSVGQFMTHRLVQPGVETCLVLRSGSSKEPVCRKGS